MITKAVSVKGRGHHLSAGFGLLLAAYMPLLAPNGAATYHRLSASAVLVNGSACRQLLMPDHAAQRWQPRRPLCRRFD